jgi:glutamate--cysteine ligase
LVPFILYAPRGRANEVGYSYNGAATTSGFDLNCPSIVNNLLDQRLNWLVRDDSSGLLRGGLKGIERETLRVSPTGELSQRPHPQELGSALTNRYITTDYSEALLEFVTPAYPSTWEVQQFLCDVHQFVYARIGDELLWGASMPCAMTADEDVPIAHYGNSNVGMMKTIYRRGLGYRYGRKMQTIAGVHFNYSMPVDFWPALQAQEGDQQRLQDFRSSMYMAMVRNLRRYGWLILYLFGTSPALCKSFLPDGSAELQELDESTWYGRYATSLRMSGLGYQNNAQAGLVVSANSLQEYVADLSAAITTSSELFQRIGVKVDGEYRQLSSNRLQIENEYYSSVRPKRRAASGQRPTEALRQQGVEYIEVRALDVNLFHPTGIDQIQMRFLEAFLIFCGLSESPAIDTTEQAEIDARQASVAQQGRRPDLKLQRDGAAYGLKDWALELVNGIGNVAELLDGPGRDYRVAVAKQREACLDPELTPAARMLSRMVDAQLSFPVFALRESQAQQAYFQSLKPLPSDKHQLLDNEARESLQTQRDIEAQADEPFDIYLQSYFDTATS